ncbi:hypothetical protein [Pseudobacteriovorax antillogorgiicola]|uniref:Carboxypeptidase regulatory-like domain-containing protein n=1 Tax=Pseudobacteriovorax antillogorgiicola TaxID=1513793 RepID=A0A1Y6CC12_9BACT|nr:hypothetical protein [Pseudobacteriovorax antillogorgiicola]TCS48354.1 hypothetical protein EDD56_118134 [Pseudobacteriovorax antillogorgiicola]SMF56255.1 hypothetical protein SAMN06296036_1187 [Pseudobacteriovorax antillogorgiicola]
MIRIITLLALISALACSKAGEPQNNETPTQLNVDQEADAEEREPSLTVSFDDSTRLDTLSGYLVGFQETYALQRLGESSEFVIPLVEAGRYDLIVTSQDAEGLSIGSRINGIQISSGGGARIRPQALQGTTTISGSVERLGGQQEGAILVSIPGTHFQAEADASGAFAIADVPLGIHQLLYQADGYRIGKIHILNLSQAGTQTLDTMLLNDAEGTGFIPAKLSTPESIAVVLTPPANANKVRVSETGDFSDAAWQDLITTIWYSFSDFGEKTLYVQYSQDETNLSAVFSETFVVEDPALGL